MKYLLSIVLIGLTSPAFSLEVGNGNVTTSKLADGSVTTPKLHLEALDGFAGVMGIDNAATFNESGADKDFRIESNKSADMLKIDGGNDTVVITAGATPGDTVLLDVFDQDLDKMLTIVTDSGGQSADGAYLHINDRGRDMDFRVGSSGQTSAPISLTVQGSDGNVGIGTAGPDQKLHVASDVNFTSAGNEGQLKISDTTNGEVRALFLGYDNTDNFGFISAEQVGTDWKNLALNPGGAYVGIRTVAPTAELHISGGTATSAKVTIGETSVAACMMYRDTDLAGWTEVGYLNGAIAYTTVDADGVCDGA